MDDYSALAQRISLNVQEVRGCLLLSRDGLVLGAYPDEEEGVAKSAWLRFSVLGEPERSFVEFTDQVWAFVHRGAYGAFAVADVGVRPGILVDQLEQVLLSADEGRAARRDTLRVPDAPVAPSGKPRSNLHPPVAKPQMAPQAAEADPSAQEEEDAPSERVEVTVGSTVEAQAAATPVVEALTAADVAAAVEASTAPPTAPPPTPPPVIPPPSVQTYSTQAEPSSSFVAPKAPEPERSTLGKEPMKLVGGAGTPPEEEEVEVDRVLLAKEFSGLLQVETGDDEAST